MTGKKLNLSDLQILLLLAAIRFIIHLLTNGQYGFHRDALAFLDNGQNLSWGYVEYPPLTPLIGRFGLELFGLSLVGIKGLAALAQCIGMVLAGLMAKELGGSRRAQVVTAVAVAIAPMSLVMGTLFQYISFDYLWWLLVAYSMLRLLKSENPKWWLGIGAGIGLGMMTKYTMVFFIAGVVIAVLVTDGRRYLRSRWLWAGALLSMLIFLPNLIWQIQNEFISFDFLSAISSRDAQLGRTEGYFSQQLYVNANPLLIFLWPLGLYFYLFSQEGKRFRAMGWLYLVPLLLFWVVGGRFYYMAPAYPMLIAAGAVVGEGWLAAYTEQARRIAHGIVYGLTAVGAVVAAILMLPLFPINSDLWQFQAGVHDNFMEQVGWIELVDNIAEIYGEKTAEYPSLGILTGNYGEAATVNLYGEAENLPTAISPVNSYWYRSLPESPPEAVIAVGFSQETLESFFTTCDVVGQNGNSFGVENEERRNHPNIYLCERPMMAWEEIWGRAQRFG